MMDFFQRVLAGPMIGLKQAVGLTVVEMDEALRCHVPIMTHLRDGGSTMLTSPGHDMGAGCCSAVEDFNPSKQATVP